MKTPMPASFVGPFPAEYAETLLDHVSEDQKFWDALKEALTTGQMTCQQVGFEIMCRVEAAHEYIQEHSGTDCMSARKEEIENALVDDGPWEAA